MLKAVRLWHPKIRQGEFYGFAEGVYYFIDSL
jgi:hypothetical protein